MSVLDEVIIHFFSERYATKHYEFSYRVAEDNAVGDDCESSTDFFPVSVMLRNFGHIEDRFDKFGSFGH